MDENNNKTECGHDCTSECKRTGCNCECGEFHNQIGEVEIAKPVHYNKFSQSICDKNNVPILELVEDNDRLGHFISNLINEKVEATKIFLPGTIIGIAQEQIYTGQVVSIDENTKMVRRSLPEDKLPI